MNKLILLFTLLLSSNYNVFSQSGWFWQNPYPVGSHLEDCFFVNENTCFAVGWDGVILKSTNGGTNWVQQNSGGNRFLMSVFFTNESTGYVVSGDESFPANNILLKTTNAGNNWLNVFTFGNRHLSCVYFLNSNTGFIVGGRYWWGGHILKTTDAGMNWTQYPQFEMNFLNSIFFTDMNTGYAAGDDGKILKTTNTGSNWFYLNSSTSNTNFSSVHFINLVTGFVAGTGGDLYKTTNEGLNWNQIATPVTEDLWDVEFRNVETGFISVGGTLIEVTGKLMSTTNSGINWDTLSVNNNQNLRGIAIRNNNVVAVGYWGTLIKSSNYGHNWFDITYGHTSTSFNHVEFTINNSGFITCSNGNILKTTDLGNSWNNLQTNINVSLTKTNFLNNQTGFAVGLNGTLIKTTNEGNNWFNLNSGTNYNLNDVQFINDLTGYIIGSYVFGQYYQYPVGNILKTSNGGENWLQILNTNYFLYCCFFLNFNTGYVSAANTNNTGRFLKTTNAGVYWEQITLPNNSLTYCFYFINESTGFAGGRINEQWASYSLLKTSNGGLNWAPIAITCPYDFYINGIYFNNLSTGYLTCVSFPDYGRAGDIFKSVDGGNTWFRNSTFSSLPVYQRRGLNSVGFVNSNTGYVIGEKGTILKTTDGGGTIGLNPYIYNLPRIFTLSQNYPNPFNPVTKIKFDIPKSSNTKIMIYDVLGKLVTTIVNEQLKPGSYEVEWDGSWYASGVYFYSIVTDEFVETKRMVLIK